MRHAVLLCALLAACASTTPEGKPSQGPVRFDRSDEADRWNRDQCMKGNKEACDELRRSTAAKR